MKFKTYAFCVFLLSVTLCLSAQELYQMPKNKETRWISFENIKGQKGRGGLENKGAKGHAFDYIMPGKSVDLVNFAGSGTIRRIWLTLSRRDPEMMRSLKIEMFWDASEKPAVSVPLGDFFGVGLGQRVPFESAFFSDPEGRSFNCSIPMPFKDHARIVITNDSKTEDVILFYDVDVLLEEHSDDMLYFHAYWNRELPTKLGQDFEILPHVEGRGRFLGTNIGVKTNPLYEDTWFGEGEVKVYLDGDTQTPTLVGSGTEDYIGTAYGQGTFNHLYQGSLIADAQKGVYAFYRYHVPDPVYFYDTIKVTIQQIGGAPQERLVKLIANGAILKPITIHNELQFTNLLDKNVQYKADGTDLPKGWVNFYRQDDVSATAYFYLDKPVSSLPSLISVENRTNQLPEKIRP